LRNPQTFAWIGIDRTAWGVRASLANLRLPVNDRSDFTIGIDLQRQRDDRTNFGNNAGQPDTARQLDQLERVTEIGPFALAHVEIAPGVSAVLGGRYDWVDFQVEDRLVTGTNPDDSGRRRMHAASGTAGLAVRWGEGGTAYFNAGTSFETPTTTELTNRPDTAGGFNALLQPQQSVGFEAGIRGPLWRRAGGGLFGNLAAYRAQIRDALISYQIPSSPGRVFFQNAGRTRHQGVEAGLEYQAGSSFVRLAWTWSDFRYRAYTARGHVLDGRRVPGIPEHQLQATWHLERRGAWLELQHSHSSSVLVDDTLDVRSPGWTTADVRAGFDGAIGNIRLAPFIGVSNLFNRQYVGSVVINAANGRYYEPAPGRHWYAGLSARFGT
jgi:iron complex outermembrane receptor protein